MKHQTVTSILIKSSLLLLSLGIMGLVLSLTVNNLLVFYQDQFQALTITLIQGAVLLLAVLYRRWYLSNAPLTPPNRRHAALSTDRSGSLPYLYLFIIEAQGFS